MERNALGETKTENDTVGLIVIVRRKGCRYYTQSVWKKVSSRCKLIQM